MDRKEACEQIILTKEEQRLLKKIRRGKKLKCSDEEVSALLAYELVEPLCQMEGGFTMPVPTGEYQVSDFYAVYAAYRRRVLLDYIADKWVDILASLISLVSLFISVAALLRVPVA